ncbi:MAG: BON domain-containing protein [Rhodocyclaceae bacterium]|nr:MAG: BON domain-containing protein [Rhodocyclaceae bacterium]
MKNLNPTLNSPGYYVWILLAGLLPILAGCFGATVVGVGAGALMAADRRPSETFVTDESIELRTGNRIREMLAGRTNVNVTSYNRAVLLTGEVPDAAARSQVEKIASGVPNVKAISNEVQIAGVSTLGARSNDAYITSKVKARFIDANKFAVIHVKVVTEAGTVYLLGMVTPRESDDAVEIARTTGGVQRVVRMFEIIPEEQARQLDSRPPGEGASKKP